MEQNEELRAHLCEAVRVLGERRVALGAQCSVSSVQHWLRRADVQHQSRTMAQVLPRLRAWEGWIHGYLAGLAETSRLEKDGMADLENRIYELRERLEQAAQIYSMDQLALACEVPIQRVLRWRLGYDLDKHPNDLARALGHLRHIDGWPEPVPKAPAREAAAAVS